MTRHASYARALYDAVHEHSEKSGDYIKNLREALKRRGHEQLLPRILTAYEALELRDERNKTHQTITPEAERTRTLLELYRKLITTHE